MTNKLYKLFIANFFNIKGRSSRKEFICRFTMMWIFGFASMYLIELYEKKHNNLIDHVSVIICLFFFISFIQVFFVINRRLHDLNTSGWWQLITFIPLGQFMLIGFIFFKGTDGPNKYGPPPEY
ncbi:MAG: DUF805 domain-containing protein [Rickettsiaceae bacterium]